MKSFGHQRPVRNDDGEIVGSKLSPVKARTLEALGHNYGSDHDKRLIVSLDAADLITLRPERTARPVSITARDLYAHLLRLEAGRLTLAKAREAKARRASHLAAQRQARAERRLLR